MKSKPQITWIVPEPRWMNLHKIQGRSYWDPNMALPSVWIRSFQLAPYLVKKGFILECNKLNPQPDIAIFLRSYDSVAVELAKKLKAAGVKIVLDVVVNYFNVRTNKPGGYGASPQEIVDNFSRLIDLSDQVWTVSPFLQELASLYHPKVYFISDSVDPQHFNPTKYPHENNSNAIILSWSGVSSKAAGLENLSSLLKPLINQKLVTLCLITNKKPSLSFPFEFHKWHYSKFPKLIAQSDLCVAPRVVDDDYERGHSLFKIGVFMAMGKPALAGPVPSYYLLLDDKKGGAICETIDDWDIQLNQYIQNIPARNIAGIQAKEKMQPFLSNNIAEIVCTRLSELLS